MISIKDWKAQFLTNRELKYPTGQPLYTYRVTKDEFLELESLLKEKLQLYLKTFSLADIPQNVEYFSAMFVLYAAEWWRRSYDGTGFSWDPILKSLGAPSDGWSQTQRGDCVTRGMQEWKLTLAESRGLRFLGSIAFNGGLPMQLLARAQGNIGRVLSRVLQLAAAGTTDANEILEWVRSLALHLPNAYRRTEVFVLLTEVIVTVLDLKKRAKLTNSESALSQLDQTLPNWRDSFPLPIEDEQAQGLIEQLIRDAARTVVRTIQHIFVERRLEQVVTDHQETFSHWSLRSDFVLPEYIEASTLGNIFEVSEVNLTRAPTLRLFCGIKSVDFNLRKLAGQDRYRISRQALEGRDTSAAGEHSMMLLTTTGESKHREIIRGDALEGDLPWLFEEISDSSTGYRLAKQGSGTVASIQALVCLPSHWQISVRGESSLELRGAIAAFERLIYSVRGSVTIDDREGSSYRVTTGQAAAATEQIDLRGTRVWDTFLQPDRAFKGIPKLFRIAENGLAQVAQGSVGWRLQDGLTTTTPNQILGPVSAIWPAQGGPQWRSRVVLLPTEAIIRILPGVEIRKGSVRFSKWGLVAAQSETDGVIVTTNIDGDGLLAHFEYQGADNPPELVVLKVAWRGNTTVAKINVPFPAQGIRALDINGNQLSNASLVSIDEASLIRMIGFLGEGVQQAELKLGLHRSTNAPATNITRQIIKANAGESRVEIRLLDYTSEIKRLLANVDHLEAYVSIQLNLNADESLSLRVARYSLEFEKYSASSEVGISQAQLQQVTLPELEKMTVNAVRINAPGEEPLRLQASTSEGALTGSWRFPADELPPGSWLIYPGKDSKLSFRPMIWPIVAATIDASTTLSSNLPEQDSEKETSTERSIILTAALDMADAQARAQALSNNIERIANDFVDDDWGLVEQLAGTLGHLPLSTLDFWRQITQSPAGMAALALRIGSLPANFVDRFPTELPFVWETIPLSAWVGAIKALRIQCEGWRVGDAGQRILHDHLNGRFESLSIACPSLRILLKVAHSKGTGSVDAHVKVVQKNGTAFMSTFTEQLFVGEQSRLQKLLQLNADTPVWPSGFGKEISAMPSEHSNMYRRLGDFRDGVINTPIFLALNAISAAHIEFGRNSQKIETIRNMQSFDSEWFAEAFDLTLARCIAAGAINLGND